MRKVAHLYFHSPCFDGIVSCVLAWDFLETSQGWNFEQIHSVNYDARASWLSTRLNTPCAVVDFLYHPQAQFWADHHLTTFLTEEARRDFERRRNRWLIYNERSGSCALLLLSHLRDSFGYGNTRYDDLVKWADEIDSASYASVNEAILGDEPALRISSSLSLGNGKTYCEYLAKELRRGRLDQVAQLPEVRERSEQARSLIKAGLNRFAEASKLVHGGIVVFDVDASDVIVNRYAPYYFFPQARYSAGIVRRKGSATITAMRNPWRDFPSVFLGKIFEKLGGGGHQRVGSIFLSEDRAREADCKLKQAIEEIRKQDTIAEEVANP